MSSRVGFLHAFTLGIIFGMPIQTPAATAKTEWRWVQSVSRQPVNPGGKVTITMKVPHGGYVDLYDPDGKLYVLSDKVKLPDQLNHGCVQYKFEEFKQMKSLTLDVDSLKECRYEYGKTPEKVFQKAGIYRLNICETSMHTDAPESMADVVKITYRGPH